MVPFCCWAQFNAQHAWLGLHSFNSFRRHTQALLPSQRGEKKPDSFQNTKDGRRSRPSVSQRGRVPQCPQRAPGGARALPAARPGPSALSAQHSRALQPSALSTAGPFSPRLGTAGTAGRGRTNSAAPIAGKTPFITSPGLFQAGPGALRGAGWANSAAPIAGKIPFIPPPGLFSGWPWGPHGEPIWDIQIQDMLLFQIKRSQHQLSCLSCDRAASKASSSQGSHFSFLGL